MGKNTNKTKTQNNTHTQKPTKDHKIFCVTAICAWCLFSRFCDCTQHPIKKAFVPANPRTNQTSKPTYTIEIWLILPVVICLFQGLSHACLRITALQESAHGSLHQTQSAAKMLRSPQNWIPWRNAKLIHESTRMSSTHAACSASRSEASCE